MKEMGVQDGEDYGASANQNLKVTFVVPPHRTPKKLGCGGHVSAF